MRSLKAKLLAGRAGGADNLRDGGDRRQRLAAKAQRGDAHRSSASRSLEVA